MKLTLVPTPIGNLNDMTFRAIKVLKEVDIILAEDTRTSGKLLKHFEISTKCWSYHMHNEHSAVESLINELKGGKKIALISDAGTPAISDPGFLLVRECIAHGIEVECLPGATAFVPALVCSGFPVNEFLFLGFPPVKKGRKTFFEKLKEEKRTIVLYESPHRINKTLEMLKENLGSTIQVSLSREISKKFEEHVRGSVVEVLARLEAKPGKGEMVLVVDNR
jgi:16S rRNA (cytidine1402-2'-O)-methyltransferase